MINWSSWTDFIAMGGYGPYVWGAFGTCAVVIAAEVASLAARRRALRPPSRKAGARPAYPKGAA